MPDKPITIKSPLRLFEKQKLVTNALHVCDTVMAVCANRSGKTTIAIDVAAEWSVTLGRNDNRGIIISTNHTVIEDNIINPFMLNWPKLVDSYNSQKHVLKLKNGHNIWCISPENMGAIEGKSKVAWVLIDEWITVPTYLYNAARIRGVDESAPFLIIGTPIVEDPDKQPVGLKWGRELFGMGFNPKYCGDDVPRRDRIIGLKWGMADNPYIAESEIERIEKSPFMSIQEKRSRLYGDFPSIGEQIFDAELLKPETCGYYSDELKDFQLMNYMFVDTASGQKEKNRGDDTAIVIVGIAPEYGFYVREVIADKLSVSEIERTIINKARQYQIHSIGVEYLAAQTNYFLHSIRKSQLISDAFRFIPIKRHGGADAKPARHSRLLPYLEQGRLKFPIDGHGNFIHGSDKLVAQMIATPYTEKTHDDCIDALADICAAEMGIIDGTMQSIKYVPFKPGNNFMPLMSEEELQSISYDSEAGDGYSLNLN